MRNRPRILLCGMVVLVATLVIGCGSRWLAGGKLHFDQGRYEQALENFELAVEEQPNNGECYMWRATALASFPDNPRDEEAIADFKKALELAPILEPDVNQRLESFWSRRTNSGINSARLGDDARANGNEAESRRHLEEAIGYFNRALLFCPDSVKTIRNLGKVYFQLGRRDEGLASFERVRELSNRESDLDFIFRVYRTIGIQESEKRTKEGYQQALLNFREAATFDRSAEELATLYFNMAVAATGLAESSSGEEKTAALRQAVEYYQKVLESDANDTAALENLASVYGELGDTAAALEIGQRLLDTAPWDQRNHFFMQRLYNAADDREKSTAHSMLQSVLQKKTTASVSTIRDIVKDYPGSEMQRVLRDRGEPQQFFKYHSASRGEYLIWFYWTDGHVYIFRQGTESFHGRFRGVTPDELNEIMGS